MNYDQALRYLLSLPRKSKGENLSSFKDKLEQDLNFSFSERTPHFFHITGTNGKGTVVGYLQSLLMDQGYKVGTYQSPHVYDIRERILINGEMLSENYFSDLVNEHKGKYDCWSEYLIAMALSCFLKERCDVVVWEVGIGGRFDLTNIIEHSTCCLTSISFDLMKLLGTNLLDIAWQKIGILKSNSSLVVGRVPKEVISVIQNEVNLVKTNIWWLDKEIRIKENKVYYPTQVYENLISLEGPHQIENMALALGMLEIGGWMKIRPRVQSSLKNTVLRGRWEQRRIKGIEWIFDGAHNQEAALSIVDYIKSLNKKWIVLGSSSLEHDPKDFFCHFTCVVDKFFWVDLSDRAWKGEIPDFFERKFTHISQAIYLIEEELKKEDYTILVLGSFYLVGEIGNYLSSVNY